MSLPLGQSSMEANGVSSEQIQEIAVRLAKALNKTQPNQSLAERVIAFANTSGSNTQQFKQLCGAFGRFDDQFLENIHTDIRKWQKPSQSKESAMPAIEIQAVANIGSNQYDVEQKGGLIRPAGKLANKAANEQHVFQKPTPQKSLLGLDRLAEAKRLELGITTPSASTTPTLSASTSYAPTETKPDKVEFKRPNPISSRLSFQNEDEGSLKRAKIRSRRIETPSYTGGVSDEYRSRVEERRERDKNRGNIL
ncbi:hypothetical protein BDF19DRAFT_22200 [Syncephalis fuscata]|nr:hypothetical protein BDF19DRAFT_22200 [Syncephalis fuscata]